MVCRAQAITDERGRVRRTLEAKPGSFDLKMKRDRTRRDRIETMKGTLQSVERAWVNENPKGRQPQGLSSFTCLLMVSDTDLGPVLLGEPRGKNPHVISLLQTKSVICRECLEASHSHFALLLSACSLPTNRRSSEGMEDLESRRWHCR